MTFSTIIWIICIVAVAIVIVFGVLTQLKSTRGKYGELVVRGILWSLPREYRVFNDVRFYVGRSLCQIDHLVISRYGIFVIETKSYFGLTVGDSAQSMWQRHVLGMHYKTRSPLIQNQRHVELLMSKYPEIISCLNEAIYSVVVFGFGSLVRMTDKAKNVMTIFSLRRYILRFSSKVLTDMQYQEICNLFVKK